MPSHRPRQPRPAPQLRLATSATKVSRTPAEVRVEAIRDTILQSAAFTRDFAAPPPPPPPPPRPATPLRPDEPFGAELLAHPLLSEDALLVRRPDALARQVVDLLNELLQPAPLPKESRAKAGGKPAAAAAAAAQPPPPLSCEGKHECPSCRAVFYFALGSGGPACPTCGNASFAFIYTSDPYRTFEGEEVREHWDSLPSKEEKRQRLAGEEVHRLAPLCVRTEEGHTDVAHGHQQRAELCCRTNDTAPKFGYDGAR
jgi:hypothetical protein